jgi:hypothetical protein
VFGGTAHFMCTVFAQVGDGLTCFHVQVELSPDRVHWMRKGKRVEVGPLKLVIVSLENFLRYTRLSNRAEGV